MWCASEKNPICDACFASAAIRCCFVDTGSGSKAPAMFPSNGSATRRPLSSPGSAGAVPLVPRYYGALRFPTGRPAALRFLRPAVTTPRVCIRHSDQARRRLGARGFRVWQPRTEPVSKDVETVGRPKFLGNPAVPMPCSLTPAGPQPSSLDDGSAWPSHASRRRLPREVISGLNRTALALAVYASPGGLPAQDARRASGCWPSSTGWDWLPTGFQ
jgi:hypothetical protein